MADDNEKIYCGRCGEATRHSVLARARQADTEPVEIGPDEYTDVGWYVTSDLVQCEGCETAQLRRTRFFSEWDPHFDHSEVRFFPPHPSRRRPRWFPIMFVSWDFAYVTDERGRLRFVAHSCYSGLGPARHGDLSRNPSTDQEPDLQRLIRQGTRRS